MNEVQQDATHMLPDYPAKGHQLLGSRESIVETRKRWEGQSPLASCTAAAWPYLGARGVWGDPGSAHLGQQELWQLWSVSYWVLAMFWHFPSVPGADSCKSGLCVRKCREPTATASQKEDDRMSPAASRGEAMLGRRHMESHLLLLPNPLDRGEVNLPLLASTALTQEKNIYQGLSAAQHPMLAARATEGRRSRGGRRKRDRLTEERQTDGDEPAEEGEPCGLCHKRYSGLVPSPSACFPT